MKRIAWLLLLISLVLVGVGCDRDSALPYILPVEMVRNDIRITVDPRVELVSIVQYLSRHGEMITTADFSYRTDVDEHFGKYRNHEAVTMYESMVEAGFRFSSPANFALG